MPLFLHKNIELDGELGVWKIEEGEEWFLERLELQEAERKQLSEIKGRRRQEWLSVRHLVHYMSGRVNRGAFVKDQFGKPHLEHSSFQISISHSREMAAAIAAPTTVGIDIQKIVPKIERIAHKFMRGEEMDSLEPASRLEHLHVYWGAKEALYKAYGRKELDFCEHILVKPFTYDLSEGKTNGVVIKNSFRESYQLRYERIGDYILVYGVAEKKMSSM